MSKARKRAQQIPPHPAGKPGGNMFLFGGAVLVVAAVTVAAILFSNGKSSPRDSGNTNAIATQGGSFGLSGLTVPIADSEPDLAASVDASTNGGSSQGAVHPPQDPIQKANLLLTKGDVRAAIAIYEQALRSKPQDEELHFNLGMAYARINEFQKAEIHYREALRILPDYPEVHNNFGNLLLRLGRLREAEGHFREAIKLMPEYASAHNNLGIAQQRQNRPDESIEHFVKATQLDTNYWQAFFNLGNALSSKGDKDGAAKAYKETLRLNPEMALAKRKLSELSGQAGPR